MIDNKGIEMNFKKQSGMTTIGIFIVLCVLGFLLLILFKIIPMQIESYKVSSAVEKLKHVPYLTKKSRREILTILQKQFDIEDVETVKPKHIKITKKAGVMTVSIEYERRTSVIKPYGIVGTFKSNVEVVAN